MPTMRPSLIKEAVVFIIFCTMSVLSDARVGKLSSEQSAVSYTLSGGRLGDNLLSFAHAAWIAHMHPVKLLYTPFPFCEKFALSNLCVSLTQNASSLRRAQLSFSSRVTQESVLEPHGILYVVPYFPDFLSEWNNWPFAGPGNGPCCTINWQDKGFVARMRKFLKPIEPIITPELPLGHASVALHIRRGGGFDPENIAHAFPYKFPPLTFYSKGLHFLLNNILLHDTPIFVFVFTDDPNPRALVNSLREQVPNKNIVWQCREVGNSHNNNVLEDFVFMQKFHYIIRPHSNYSYLAAKVGMSKIDIEPHMLLWQGNELVVGALKVNYDDGSQQIIA